MSVKAREVTRLIEQLAPLELAEDWDNVGWQVGDPDAPIQSVLVTLDFTPAVLEEARREKADLIITHHPFLFKPLRQVRYDQLSGKLLRELVQNRIMLYSAHTNLDNAPEGVSQVLGESLGLSNMHVFGSNRQEKLYKLVVFVPEGHEDEVRQAVSEAGAGWIGNYSHCTFQIPGTGTFLPRDGTSPFIGQQGKLEKVAEYRLETIVPERILNSVVQAMIEAHPYEEVAYDVYPLHRSGQSLGPGRLGILQEPMKLGELIEQVKQVLRIAAVRVIGDPSRLVQKVAVCGGSGAFLIPAAASSGAEVLITGDVKYHEAQEAANRGLAIIDAGHQATEYPAIEFLTGFLREKLSGVRVKMFDSRPLEKYY